VTEEDAYSYGVGGDFCLQGDFGAAQRLHDAHLSSKGGDRGDDSEGESGGQGRKDLMPSNARSHGAGCRTDDGVANDEGQ
jgi:hypothetical protein